LRKPCLSPLTPSRGKDHPVRRAAVTIVARSGTRVPLELGGPAGVGWLVSEGKKGAPCASILRQEGSRSGSTTASARAAVGSGLVARSPPPTLRPHTEFAQGRVPPLTHCCEPGAENALEVVPTPRAWDISGPTLSRIAPLVGLC